jgi:hypothetical protein
VIPRAGLVAEYLFGGNANDTSGHDHHGTVHGAALTTDRFGTPDSAYRFDGDDDHIEVSPPPTLGNGAMAVSVWARFEPRELRGWSNCIIAQDDGDDDRETNQARRVFQLSAWHRHVVWHRMACLRDPIVKRRIRFGEWCHFVATVEDRRHVLYQDGVRHDETEADFRTHPDQPLHIGRKGTQEKFFFFKGAIDDVRIYDRALSEAEVVELFHEGGFTKPAPAPPGREDPISGIWGQRGVNVLDLRMNAGAVHGNVMHGRPEVRAEVEQGSFDRGTGVLHLEGHAPHHQTGKMLAWRIDGRLDGDEVTVTARIGDWSGNVILTQRGARGAWRYKLARWLNDRIQRVLRVREPEEC